MIKARTGYEASICFLLVKKVWASMKGLHVRRFRDCFWAVGNGFAKFKTCSKQEAKPRLVFRCFQKLTVGVCVRRLAFYLQGDELSDPTYQSHVKSRTTMAHV